VNADAWALRWSDSAGFYRPQYQTRSRLFISTSLLDRFPKNTFHFSFDATHEYRSATWFPVGGSGAERVPGYRAISTSIHIRIMTAVISYQLNNMLGERYGQVPGFLLPRQTSLYGVQWEFWN
jgi:hypothetical protein